MANNLSIWMFLVVFLLLLTGFPVAFVLGGTALLFAGIGIQWELFDQAFIYVLPSRLYGLMNNNILIAVPLFVFMGNILEKSKIAENLLDQITTALGTLKAGLGLAATLVGMLIAASTGIVGATVVTMGLLSLPTMLKHNYNPAISCGIICASGTLGQIIPPSIVLVLLGDVLSTAYQEAQLEMGNFAPATISVGDMFAGALLPGISLVLLYIIYLMTTAWLRPAMMPPLILDRKTEDKLALLNILKSLLPPLILIFTVLGSILGGLATPTEAASVGAIGALVLACVNQTLNMIMLKAAMQNTTQITSMVFLILIGAAMFSLVFRGYGGDELIVGWLSDLPGNKYTAVLVVMLAMFLLGFVLDFIEIIFVVVPIVGPILLAMGIDPIWLGVMMAINLQTSFLTPPFGFALFYVRGIAPEGITTQQIYRGVLPFIFIQVLMLGILAYWPQLATWLPQQIYR